MLNGAEHQKAGTDEDKMAALCETLDLQSRGLALAQANAEDLYDAFQSVLTGARFLRDDATGVLISADAAARFQSGII
jgi:DNA-binding NarL/FixJ family response regulator